MRHFALLLVTTAFLASTLQAEAQVASPAPTTPITTTPLVLPPVPGGPSVRVGGYLQVRETWQDPTGLSASLNRARLSADVHLPSRFSFRTLVEYEASGSARTAAGVSLRDAYIRWAFAPVAFTFGQYKTPFSREYITSITAIEGAERPAVVDTLAPKRDIGIMGECVLPLFGVWIGVFNGEGQNLPLNRDSTLLLVTRVLVRPIAQATVAGNVANSGGDSTRYGVEVSLEESGVLVRAELIGRHREGRRDDLGWFVLAGLRVLPWLQLIARQEDFERPVLGPARRIRATTTGLNVELPGGKTRFLVNHVARTTGAPAVRRNALISQLQIRF